VAASYSVRMSSLYFAVNDRRRGWSERGLIGPFSMDVLGRSAAVRVNLIKPVLALCGREKVLPKVSHISLTHRGALPAWIEVDKTVSDESPESLHDFMGSAAGRLAYLPRQVGLGEPGVCVRRGEMLQNLAADVHHRHATSGWPEPQSGDEHTKNGAGRLVTAGDSNWSDFGTSSRVTPSSPRTSRRT
jgi:hypothetical protein